MATIKINYRFHFDNKTSKDFDLTLDDDSVSVIDPVRQSGPAWTKLDHHKCSHCPLDSRVHEYCPAALSLVDCVNSSSSLMSFDQIELEVCIDNKITTCPSTVQKSLSSLIGLLLSTSGCPYLDFFKPMARQHLPLASEKDTIYRAVGMYLLAQYYLKEAGNIPDLSLDGLALIYEKLQVVNLHLSQRLREASQTDSSVNAVILLDLFSKALPLVIEDKLEDIQGWFNGYNSPLYFQILGELSG